MFYCTTCKQYYEDVQCPFGLCPDCVEQQTKKDQKIAKNEYTNIKNFAQKHSLNFENLIRSFTTKADPVVAELIWKEYEADRLV